MYEAIKEARKRYRQKVKRIYLDFYPSEAGLLAHVEAQEKKQTFIKDLIRRDKDTAGQWVIDTEYGEPAMKEVTGIMYHCTRCGRSTIGRPKFCPDCGARMCDRLE